jgi:hypothetical protein
MLSNLETDNAKLLQIILVGQPELRQTLALPSLVQLRQRICFYCHIQPLKHEEVGIYILHRLEVAGNREAVTFLPEALDLIWQYSKGIPRLINIICDFLMLSAFAEESKQIDEEMVRDISGDLDFENQYWSSCVPDKPADGKAGPLTTGTESANEIMPLLQEISQRLDRIEKESLDFKAIVNKELYDKLTSLTVAFQMQSDHSSALIGAINSKIEKIINERDSYAEYEEEKIPKDSFMTRLFK